MEQWQTIFLGSKITADGDCSHEIKRHLAPWKKSYDQPREQIKKQRHLPTKVQLVKTMVFPVVMFRCERWTIKKAQRWGTDAFELWCSEDSWVPWTSRRSNQCILKEISPEYSLTDTEAPILWPPDAKNWLSGKDSDIEKDWRHEKGTTEDEMVGWHHRLDGHEFEQACGAGDGQGGLAMLCCSPWGHRVGQDWATELVGD